MVERSDSGEPSGADLVVVFCRMWRGTDKIDLEINLIPTSFLDGTVEQPNDYETDCATPSMELEKVDRHS